MPRKPTGKRKAASAEVSDWEAGLSLSQARAEFCDPLLWAEYETAWATAFPPLPPDDLPAPRPTQATQINVGPLPVEPFVLWERATSLDQRVNEATIELLRDAKLLALGFVSPRRRKQLPTRIPAELWKDGRVSWSTSQLWAETAVFEEVHCVPSQAFRAAAVLASIPVPAPARGPGRPSRRADIITAYRSYAKKPKSILLRSNEIIRT